MDELERIKKLAREGKIVFAPQDKIKSLRPWLEKIREALQLRSWFISNESMISDFGCDDEELQELSQVLGVEVRNTDYLVDLAERMKNVE